MAQCEIPLYRRYVNIQNTQEIVAKCVEYGIYVLKNVGEGALPQTAWIMDPDGYWIEVCWRCFYDQDYANEAWVHISSFFFFTNSGTVMYIGVVVVQ